jgi:uncharacterized YccA/Bax inhibitor family protein
MTTFQSSNPALLNDDAFSQFYGKNMYAAERPSTITLQGVVNKTALLVGIAIVAGAAGYWIVGQFAAALMLSWIVAGIVSLGLFFLMRGQARLAPILAPIYAVAQGFFLGALTGALDHYLQQLGRGLPGGLALQAFVITISVTLGMLGLYSSRILRPGPTLTGVIVIATVGIMLTYAVSFVMGLFGMELPFVTLGSAIQGGKAALIGLAFNAIVLVVASLWLLLDFQMIEQRVEEGGPKAVEWYCGYALLITLAWIYYEALKMAFRLALLFGSKK